MTEIDKDKNIEKLEKEKFGNLFDSINLSDLNGIIDEIISVLNDVWMMFRNKKLSFDIKSETHDIDTLINKLKMWLSEDYKWNQLYLFLFLW